MDRAGCAALEDRSRGSLLDGWSFTGELSRDFSRVELPDLSR